MFILHDVACSFHVYHFFHNSSLSFLIVPFVSKTLITIVVAPLAIVINFVQDGAPKTWLRWFKSPTLLFMESRNSFAGDYKSTYITVGHHPVEKYGKAIGTPWENP